jgi:hypothetical protein
MLVLTMVFMPRKYYKKCNIYSKTLKKTFRLQEKLALERALKNMKFLQFCGSGIFIPDLNFFHPGSRVKKIPDPYKRIEFFCNPKDCS